MGGKRVDTLRCCGALDLPGAKHKKPTECAAYTEQRAAAAGTAIRLKPRREIAKRAAAQPAAFLHAAKGLAAEAEKKGYMKCRAFFQHGVCGYDKPDRPCCYFPCGYKDNSMVQTALKSLE